MSVYKGKEILDMTDQELVDTQYDLMRLLADRENRVHPKTLPNRLKKNNGSPQFNFDKINPAFVQIQIEIHNELEMRKARG